jgi:hypothetical protein
MIQFKDKDFEETVYTTCEKDNMVKPPGELG